MKSFDGAAAEPAAVSRAVSRPELEKLAAQRRQPVLTHVLTPPGMQAVTAKQDHAREERLRHIAARLEGAKGRVTADFSKGKSKDLAKKDFERSR